MTSESSYDDSVAVLRWVISPYDLAEHLVSDAVSTGVVLTRCGRSLPNADTTEHHAPITNRICSGCEAIYLTLADAPGRFARQE
jgi:hypothetical protein